MGPNVELDYLLNSSIRTKTTTVIDLVVPWSGRRLLARIGAEIGTNDRGGAIGPPNRSENDDRGGRRGGDLHRSASFRPPKPERANQDKFRKPSGMSCSRFPSAIFSWGFWRFGISAWSAIMKNIWGRRGWSGRSDRADPARFRKGGVGSRSAWSWSGQFRSGVPDRPIGVRSVRSGTTKVIDRNDCWDLLAFHMPTWCCKCSRSEFAMRPKLLEKK